MFEQNVFFLFDLKEKARERFFEILYAVKQLMCLCISKNHSLSYTRLLPEKERNIFKL